VTPWIGIAIALLLIIVVLSYRQTCYAYPTGGGAYVVSRENFGDNAALTAASALLTDYILTVAVSVAAGVQAITSYFPGLTPHAVELSLAFIALLTLVNLRGIKESGTSFAIPTYGFVMGIYIMFAVGTARLIFGHHLTAQSSHYGVHASEHAVGLALVFLVLRAFASGCTALTGVEAISNGVPAFRPPKSRNAANTLLIMGTLAVTMFMGITVLAMVTKVHMVDPNHLERLTGAPSDYKQPTALAQIAKAVFHGVPGGPVMFAYIQATTAGILVLAANTAFNGFPVLASILSRDGFLPRQLHKRGDRLVFSNGIILLALAAALLIVVFHANTDSLIQLYIIGVFVSFTLSQSGMVKHWQRELRNRSDTRTGHVRRSQSINAAGATVTAIVLVIVLFSKFLHGAWLVCIAMPLLFLMMKGIQRHYRRTDEELVPSGEDIALPARNHAVVLVSKIHKPTLRAVAYARATRPSTLEAVTVSVDPEESARLQEEWDRLNIPVPLKILDSPYREITRPILRYVKEIRRRSPRDVVSVYLPEYVVGRWWEHLLHNQSALRLKGRLLFQPGVMVTSVPWQLHSSDRLRGRRERPAPGSARRPYGSTPEQESPHSGGGIVSERD
jgi:amino acid transporter